MRRKSIVCTWKRAPVNYSNLPFPVFMCLSINILYFKYPLFTSQWVVVVVGFEQSHLNFAAQLQEFLTGSLDAFVDSFRNDPGILFTPSLLDKDRWHLDLMIAYDFIGPSTEDHETCRCGSLIYSTNKRPHQGSLCVSCITRRASIIHFERACYLLLLRDAVRTNTNWNNT